MDILRINDVLFGQKREFCIQHKSLFAAGMKYCKRRPAFCRQRSYQFCVQHCITKNKLTVLHVATQVTRTICNYRFYSRNVRGSGAEDGVIRRDSEKGGRTESDQMYSCPKGNWYRR